MKRKLFPLLALALAGTLLLVGCAEQPQSPKSNVSTSSDDNALISSEVEPAEQFYLDNGFQLPDDFYRSDLIWDVGSNFDADMTIEDFTDSSLDVSPREQIRNKLLMFINFPENADESLKYAIRFDMAKPEAEDSLKQYLTNEGWEALEVPENHQRVEMPYGNFFIATRTQVEALDESQLMNYLLSDEELSTENESNSDFLTGIRYCIAPQSIGPIDSYNQEYVINYRPDLVWETYPDYFNEDQLWIPFDGELYARFLLSNLEPGEEYGRLKHPDREFAVYFLYYDWDDNYLSETGKIRYCNWDALVEYLSTLGIEEIGKEGGFSIPIFAATIAELEALDCDILQDLMEVSDYTDHGLSVCISSVNEEINQMDFRYAQMHSWNENAE